MAGELVKLGPNEMKGSIWEEKGCCPLVQILISHNQDGINSLQFIYTFEMNIMSTKIYGEPCALKFHTVTFGSGEFLTSVSGEYDNGRLVSIVFGTSKRSHGPYGMTTRSSNSSYDDFSFQFGPFNCFGGFHGSVYNGCVYAIGVYLKPPDNVDDDILKILCFNRLVANERIK